jgi:hypothetical protein
VPGLPRPSVGSAKTRRGRRPGCNLARPGGNVTGMSIQQLDLVSKRLELLRQVIPVVIAEACRSSLLP